MAERMFFMVLGDRGPPSYRHDGFDSAKEECERLARQNPGKTFYVLRAIGSAVSNDVRWEELDDIPF